MSDPPCPTTPLQSLVTLLWSLATLRAAQQRRAPSRLQPLLHAVTGQLARRMEAVLGSRSDTASAGSAASVEQGTLDEQSGAAAGSDWFNGPSNSSISMLPASPAELAALPTDTLCTVVWACGQLRHADTRLLQAATTLLHGRVDDMAPADMTRCLQGVAKDCDSAGVEQLHSSDCLGVAMCTRQRRLQHYTAACPLTVCYPAHTPPCSPTRALWGLGQLGYCPAPLLTSLSLRLQQPGALAPLDTRQLAMASYAFAALDFFPGEALWAPLGAPFEGALHAQ